MTKRRLNRRQQWRIKKIQEERLSRADNKKNKFTDEFQHLNDQINHGTYYHGVVVSHFGTSLDIEDTDTGCIFRCALRQNIDTIVCGDNIVWQKLHNRSTDEQLQGVVTALEERATVLSRPDFTGQMKPVAANIEQMVIITSPLPELNEGLVDRYLVAAELSHIQPILVLNKIDTLSSVQKSVLEKRINTYEKINYPVFYISAKSHCGLENLYRQLEEKTSVFVGQSGVGKSSIINALHPEAKIKEGEVSQSTQKGTHTTSVSRLYTLNFYQASNASVKNARLIDSPGVREFGLWSVDKKEVIQGFIELHQYAQHCRFRDCHHLNEPGCGLLKALKDKTISQQRLESYHRIVASL